MRRIGGDWYILVSYWDAGWVLLEVNDPATAELVDDTSYPECDVWIGATIEDTQSDVDPWSCPPEGNGHQAEWNEAGNLFLGTDEDSSSYRLLPIEVTEQTTGTGTATNQPAVGTQYSGGEFGWTVPIAGLEDGVLNGPVAWGGYGCDESAPIPDASVLDPFMIGDPDEERIVVLQRGPVSDPGEAYEACFFPIKIENAQDAGYDAVIIVNHHVGSAFGDQANAFFCGGQGHTFTKTLRGCAAGTGPCTSCSAPPPNYGTDSGNPGYPEADMNDSLGVVGPKLETSSFFDGFGMSGCTRSTTRPGRPAWSTRGPSRSRSIATSLRLRDLTVHEVATGNESGNDADLVYSSWYAGGFRVARFDETGIEEVGAFIDQGGNDLWGVQLTDRFTATGDRIVAVSGRDFGLYLLAYTGP